MADSVFTVSEKTSQKFSGLLKDENGTAIPAVGLTTLKLTLYERRSGSIVNGRNAQDVLNANNVTVDADGNLVWVVQPADLTIIGTTTPPQEAHVALFEWTYASGAKRGQYEVLWIIRNSAKVV